MVFVETHTEVFKIQLKWEVLLSIRNKWLHLGMYLWSKVMPWLLKCCLVSPMRSTVPTANPPPVWKDETVFSETFLSFLLSAERYLSGTAEALFTAGSFIFHSGKIIGVTNNNNDCPVLRSFCKLWQWALQLTNNDFNKHVFWGIYTIYMCPLIYFFRHSSQMIVLQFH